MGRYLRYTLLELLRMKSLILINFKPPSGPLLGWYYPFARGFLRAGVVYLRRWYRRYEHSSRAENVSVQRLGAGNVSSLASTKEVKVVPAGSSSPTFGSPWESLPLLIYPLDHILSALPVAILIPLILRTR